MRTLEPTGGDAPRIRLIRGQGKRGVHDSIGGGARPAGGSRAGRKALAVIGTLLAFALVPASAQALLVHTFTFGSAGSGAGQLTNPQGVAVNQSTGDVYVVDAGNFRVDKFTPNSATQSGGFDLAFGQNVGGTGVNVCTTTCQAGTQGTSAGAFQAPQFVAVDNSTSASAGDVYVGDPGDDTISKFDANGNLITTWGTNGQLSGATTFGSIDGITVDNSGNLFVINGGNPIYEFSQNGTAVTNFATTRGMTAAGLDVNTAGNFFKVNGDGSPEELTSAGADIGTVSESNGTTTGLVVDRSTNDLYQDVGGVVNHYVFNSSGSVVDAGGPCPVVPDGSCAPTDTFGTGILSAGTGVGFYSTGTEAFVADAGHNDVVVFGPPSPGPPVVDQEFASGVGSTYANLNAEINPFDHATTCQFEYGLTTAYGTTVPCTAALTANFSDQQATVAISGLTINTTYHFRVDATNSAVPAGTMVMGPDQTFTTLGPVSIDSETASNIGSTSATLNAQVNPLGTDTTCTFNYILDSTYVSNGGTFAGATSVPCTPADLGAGKADVAASAGITGLTPSTLYDFQVVATNALATTPVAGAAAQFTTGPPLSVDSEFTTNVGAESATLNTLINPLGLDTTCAFQYVDDATFKASGYSSATSVACTPADLGAGTSDVSATANITGLTPSTLYHFRAVGTNSLAPSGLPGADTTFMTPPPGVVDSQVANNITPTSASLSAQVNPEGLDTTCQFQYVDQATFTSSGGFASATTVACTPADLGSGIGDVAATANITGLTANTMYHFRVVATNSANTFNGNNDTFRTGGGPSVSGLPDGRAYEMVSPPNKNGGEVGTGGSFSLSLGTDDEASPDGNKIVYFSLSPFGDAQAGGLIEFYLASRGATGWTTHGLVPPQAPSNTLSAPNFQAFSSDLSTGALIDGGGGEFAQDSPALVPGEPANITNLFSRSTSTGATQLVNVTPSSDTPAPANFDGGSADLSHIVFDESAQLTPNAPPGTDNLYQWDSATGKVSLIGGGAHLGSGGRVLGAVSADGSRIFYSASNGNFNMLQSGSPPVQLDKPQGGPGPGGGGQFMAASTDGSEVFFTDSDGAGLTPISDTVPGSGANLYRYDVGLGTLTDLTGGNSNVNVDGVVGASQDGSIVYFVANGALANSGAPASVANQPNLYVNQQGTTTYIATLSFSDGSDWGGTNGLTARVTPDGTHLAFDSVNNLTGYNNTDATTGSPDTEVFLYTFGSGLVCASCRTDGSQPKGSSVIESAATSNVYLSRNLSDDGSRLFFDSTDTLLPAATNVGKRDVYEWDNGQLRLISTGTSTTDDGFFDASANGNDVFFRTRQQLLPQDQDTHYDLYDARVGGGFPVPPPPPPPCLGDACKPASTPAPAPPVVATISFVGPGNPTPPGPPSIAPLTKPKVTTKSVVVKSGKFSFDVRVPGKGKIKISGSGLKAVSKSVGKAGMFKLTVSLTAKELSKLKKAHNGKLTIMTHVTFTSASGASSTATVQVTVKR